MTNVLGCVELSPKVREPRYRSRVAAKMLGVSHWWLCQEIREGRLAAVRIANRYELTEQTMNDLLASCLIPAQKAA